MKPLQATKWISIQALLEVEELISLFSLSPFKIIQTGRVVPMQKKEIPHPLFFEIYKSYIDALKVGEVNMTQTIRETFSCCLTKDDSSISEQVLQNNVIARATLPVVQLQVSSFHLSKEPLKIFPQVFGKDTISWGLYISFPQLYQDQETGEPKNSRTTSNGELFHLFQKWTRENTLPTTFLIDDKKLATPLRLGKKCLSWINTHPQLTDLKVAL